MSVTGKTTYNIKKLVALAVFAALAYVVHFIHIPVGFLNLDFKDVIMTVAGMYFGPLAGVVVAVLVPLLEFPTSSTGAYGLIMNLFGSVTFVGVASLIYKFKRTLAGAVVALSAAALSMVAVMMVANIFVTPHYMGTPQAVVIEMIPKVLLPFNAVKAVLNAALVLCLYKPMTTLLKKAGISKPGAAKAEVAQPENSSKLRSVLVFAIGGIIAVAALVVIFAVLEGDVVKIGL